MPTRTVSDRRRAVAEALREAEQVQQELRTALSSAGIVLPSLGVDALSYGDESSDPLVELGRCNLRTARSLIAALGGARAPQPTPQP